LLSKWIIQPLKEKVMKFKFLLAAVGMAASLCATAAPVFTVKNVALPFTGPFSIKLVGYESFSGGLVPGTSNFGVLKVTSISTAGGLTTIWNDGDNGAEITGTFNGIVLSAVTPVLPGIVIIDSIGGLANFFINPIGSLAAAGGFNQGFAGYAGAGCAVGGLCYDGISNVAAGGSLVNAAWGSGIKPGDLATTVSGQFDGTTLPASGTARGYLDVTGGTYADFFNTDSQVGANGEVRDLFAQNQFCPPGPACDGGANTSPDWQLFVNDPINGVLRIPEPGSMALVGLGLLGLAAIRRRKV
jgi:hypothetical protein